MPQDREMTAQDALQLLELFDQHAIEVWVDGGWAVDAVLGEQTRSHADLDIALAHSDVPALRRLLEERGYKDVPRPDTRDTNFVLGDAEGHEVDVHSFIFDAAGNNVYGVPYPKESLTGFGAINGFPVKCVPPEWLVKFHTGYAVDEDDYRDVTALCNRFGFTLPPEYARFQQKG